MRLYKLGGWFFGYLPLSLRNPVAAIGGLLSFIAFRRKARLVGDNLDRVVRKESFGAKSSLALAAYVSYAKYWAEALSMGFLDRQDLESRMSFSGFEHVYEALGQGRGVIITSPHLGNWDFGAAWFAAKGFPITAVMEDLDPQELFDWFADLRLAFGIHAIPPSSNSFRTLVAALSRGEAVALVADRDMQGSGIPVSFFGEKTPIPQGVALLALRTGAPIIPMAIYMLPGGHHLAFAEEPVNTARCGSLREDVERITNSIISRYEALILADPVQWHLFQPNWPSQMESDQ